jgi:hypothetical protein
MLYSWFELPELVDARAILTALRAPDDRQQVFRLIATTYCGDRDRTHR